MNIRKSAPSILTGVGIVGMVLTVVMAIKATPKCDELLTKAEARLKETYPEKKDVKLSKKETVTCYAKAYWAAAACGVISTAAFIASNYLHGKREAILSTAFGVSEAALRQFQQSTMDVVGEKSFEEIKAKMADTKLKETPKTSATEVEVKDPKKTTLCFDCYSGRYFNGDIETIRQSVNNLNARLIEGEYVSLNDLYYELGLPEIKMGDDLGWHKYDSYRKQGLDISYSARIAEDGTPCIVIDYTVEPAYWDRDFT